MGTLHPQIGLFRDDPLAAQTVADHAQARQLVAEGARVVVSTSGGKDSQAMLCHLASWVPVEQMVAVTADLGEMEWPSAVRHAKAQAEALGIEHHVVHPKRTLLQSIRRRGKWSAMGTRYCTSDHKRAPIDKCIRSFGRHGTILNCTGERWAVNSHPGTLRCSRRSCRCKRAAIEENGRLTFKNRQRIVYNYRPIVSWSTEQVFDQIKQAGQQPHPLYSKGLTRLSCSFCVFGRLSDLRLAQRERPDFYAELVRLEAEMGHTFRKGFALSELSTAADDGAVGPP